MKTSKIYTIEIIHGDRISFALEKDSLTAFDKWQSAIYDTLFVNNSKKEISSMKKEISSCKGKKFQKWPEVMQLSADHHLIGRGGGGKDGWIVQS